MVVVTFVITKKILKNLTVKFNFWQHIEIKFPLSELKCEKKTWGYCILMIVMIISFHYLKLKIIVVIVIRTIL